MKSGIEIRRAIPEDGKAIRRMVFDVLAEFGVPADPDDDDADIMEFGNPKSSHTIHLTALSHRQPVGSAILTPSGQNRAKLSKLFVKKDLRGLGLGADLLTRIVEEATQAGFEEIYLRTRERYAAAVRLYERSGWQRGPDQPPPGPDRLYFLRIEGTSE
jgi:GNAT superfamily N-acetyltransferase